MTDGVDGHMAATIRVMDGGEYFASADFVLREHGVAIRIETRVVYAVPFYFEPRHRTGSRGVIVVVHVDCIPMHGKLRAYGVRSG